MKFARRQFLKTGLSLLGAACVPFRTNLSFAAKRPKISDLRTYHDMKTAVFPEYQEEVDTFIRLMKKGDLEGLKAFYRIRGDTFIATPNPNPTGIGFLVWNSHREIWEFAHFELLCAVRQETIEKEFPLNKLPRKFLEELERWRRMYPEVEYPLKSKRA